MLLVLASSARAADDPAKVATKPTDKPADKPIGIKKADGEIKIDGVLDEPAWKNASPQQIDYLWGKTGQKIPLKMTVRYTWDDQYFYIGYETFDKNMEALGSGKKEGPENNLREGAELFKAPAKIDLTEFFISFGDPRFFWEVHHNALNNFNDIWIVVTDDDWAVSKTLMARFGIFFGHREIVDDDTKNGFTLKTAVKLKPKSDGSPSTVNDTSDEDAGYFGEIRLPWLGLGAPVNRESFIPEKDPKTGKDVQRRGPWKMAGQEMMILAVCQDGDSDPVYHHNSATFPGSWFHKGFKHYPRYVLEGADAAGAKK